MIETDDYMSDEERQAWLTSARAYGAAFPEFADLVSLIEARLLAVRPALRVVERLALATNSGVDIAPGIHTYKRFIFTSPPFMDDQQPSAPAILN